MQKIDKILKGANHLFWFIGVISIAVMFRLHIRSAALREAATVVAVFYILLNINKYFPTSEIKVEE